MNIKLFLCALGLAFFMEGLFYTVFSQKLPGLFFQMAGQKPATFRKFGLLAMLAGLAMVALTRYGS